MKYLLKRIVKGYLMMMQPRHKAYVRNVFDT